MAPGIIHLEVEPNVVPSEVAEVTVAPELICRGAGRQPRANGEPHRGLRQKPGIGVVDQRRVGIEGRVEPYPQEGEGGTES